MQDLPTLRPPPMVAIANEQLEEIFLHEMHRMPSNPPADLLRLAEEEAEAEVVDGLPTVPPPPFVDE